jgi:serine/threonine protein kinase/dienelactone hydrolase
MLSHYRLIEKIGEGGMGEVYLAEDTRLGRQVAVKVLPEKFFGDAHAQERFQREARSASALNHPHICTIYDVGEQDRHPFMVMELLRGQTLKERIGSGPLSKEELLETAVQIVDALATAHAEGIVHRDIKPANIFITERGDAKILDFGLAKVMRSDPGAEADTQAETADDRDLTRPGTTMGTIAYMSPEQVLGKPLDARSDLFSFGVVLYEMATGTVPFKGDTLGSIFDKIVHQPPEPSVAGHPELPAALEAAISSCLEKDAEARAGSAKELRAELQRSLDELRGQAAAPARKSRRPLVLGVVAIFAVGLAAVVLWNMSHSRRIQQAKATLPEIAELVGEGRGLEAYRLAESVEDLLVDDPEFRELLSEIAVEFTVETEPPGATVFSKPYDRPDAEWERIGETPIEGHRAPTVYTRWKLEKAGHETVVDVQIPGERDLEGSVWVSEILKWTLTETGSAQEGMVRVPPTDLPAFWVDKYEVTNRQYLGFIHAGGFRNPDYWRNDFVDHGELLSFDAAMRRFVDRTGLPGPSTWEGGEYASGEDDHPVTGVSWYEAAAYAEFADKSLPTLQHWKEATGHFVDGSQHWLPGLLLPISNFGGDGTRPVGASLAITPLGAHDMAGNVREWCWNASEAGRTLRGGAWNDQPYMYGNISQAGAFDRSEKNGFRCVRYDDVEEIDVAAFEPLEIVGARDLLRETPVSDEVFQAYREQFAYDATELDAVVVEREEKDDWIREHITFKAAYGDERVPAELMLPRSADPPYQVVVYFAGDGVQWAPPLGDLDGTIEFVHYIEFLIKTGRAVFYLAYQGAHERKALRPEDWDGLSRRFASYKIQQVQDFLRGVDYLETRSDIDAERIAFYGFSRGGVELSLVAALDDRYKTAISAVGGMVDYPMRPEIDTLNFTPRVTMPVLMLNGRYDMAVMLETSARPMHELLGTPKEHKKLVIYDADHFLRRKDLISEIRPWLDTYLGPVELAER